MATETTDDKSRAVEARAARMRLLGAAAVLGAALLLAKVHTAGIDRRYAPQTAPGTIVNVNTADEATLGLLAEIGPERARSIIAYREVHGPFRSFPDLEKVDGIGRQTTKALLGRIRFDG